MAYEKTTPLMSSGPTRYNRPAAMAGYFGDDIEMSPDFAGKGADPSTIQQPVPTKRSPAASPGIAGDPRSMVMLGAAALVAYLLLRKG